MKYMSLSDAIQTGRPIKRANESQWRNVQDGTICVTPEDLLADDWIFKSAPLELEIYVSPDKTQISLEPENIHWDRKQMIEKINE
jgi:hypothetical protein